MAWRRIGDKPLSEPMLTRFTGGRWFAKSVDFNTLFEMYTMYYNVIISSMQYNLTAEQRMAALHMMSL